MLVHFATDWVVTYGLLDLILYIPVNKFSVMSGWVFMGLTIAKQGLMCLAHGYNAVSPARLEPAAFRSPNQALYHCATVLSVTYGVSTHVN